jgi:hypothetical protein
MLETLALPATFKMEDCEHFEEVKQAESVSTMIHKLCRVIKEELQACCFTFRSSNSRIVQLYMSRQMDAKGMLTNDSTSWHIPSTCSGYVMLTRSCSCPRARRRKQKMGAPSLFLGASLVEGLEGSPAARIQNDSFDPVTDEIEQWEQLSQDSFSVFVDAGALLR